MDLAQFDFLILQVCTTVVKDVGSVVVNEIHN